jgi:hypothetical protein
MAGLPLSENFVLTNLQVRTKTKITADTEFAALRRETNDETAVCLAR